ncbi:MAG: hypothetical protein HY737_05120 [Candidatus Omnitrophica bacterium]|nr:hypothetical protein [Candidatus Omnitrophota bacterium]
MPIPRIVSVGLILALSVTGVASATLQNQKSFKEAYPDKESKAYNCKICHDGAIGKATNLNTYGKALQTSKGGVGKAKALTVEDYRKIENDDTDQDGASNVNEWNAGTVLSDPASKPAETEK